MSPLSKGRLAKLEKHIRYVLEGLKEIGLEASHDEESAEIKLRGQQIDGVYVLAWINQQSGGVEPIVWYFVGPSLQQGFATAEIKISLRPIVCIKRKKSLPVFGKITGLKFSVNEQRFTDLSSSLEQDRELNQRLLEIAGKWGSIDIVKIMAKDEASILALAIQVLTPSRKSLASRELFQCYNRIAQHLRQAL